MTVEHIATHWFGLRCRLRAALIHDLGADYGDDEWKMHNSGGIESPRGEIQSLILQLKINSLHLRNAMRRDNVSCVKILGATVQVDWNTGIITVRK